MANKTFLTLSISLAAALLAGCASQPADQAPPAPKAAAAQPAQPAQPAVKATEADAASAMERKFQEAARSYKTVERDGKTMYCKREKVIGSTIPTMQCYTEAQLRNTVESNEELKQRMRRGGGGCVQTGGCGGG